MWVVVVLAAVMTSGCIGDECKLSGQSTENKMVNVPPGAIMTMALQGCSTCDHSQNSVVWTMAEADKEIASGDVEISLSPHCPVREHISVVPVINGDGFADNNYRNCGDVIDIDGYVTNRSNVTLLTVNARMRCASLDE